MPPRSTAAWYVRKNGWVEGPFTGDMVRHRHPNSVIGAVDLVAMAPKRPWAELRSHGGVLQSLSGVKSSAVGDWEVATPLLPAGQRVELGLLQMYAAQGRLKPGDLVRRHPDGACHAAGSVGGLFGGRRSWCTACGSPLGADFRRCQSCRSLQPDYEPYFAVAVFVCATVGLACYFVAIVSATTLAVRETTVYDIPMGERFPIAYAVTLVPAFCLAVVAIGLGGVSRKPVQSGRSDPGHSKTLSFGMTLGWTTVVLIVLTGTAVVAFSIPFFGLVR